MRRYSGAILLHVSCSLEVVADHGVYVYMMLTDLLALGIGTSEYNNVVDCVLACAYVI